MYLDYHSHSFYSFDGEAYAKDMVEAAAERGLDELCFTDHLDFDVEYHVPDFIARQREIKQFRVKYPELTVLLGAEVSLRDGSCAEKARQTLKGLEMDYIIGSVHTIDGEDVWRREFFMGKTKTQAYREYIEKTAEILPCFPEMNSLGHYDFVAKYAPYKDRSVCLADAPDAFDAIFRFLISHGMTLEINTASWQQDAPWGQDIFKRFHQLGGDYVAVGSDTHGTERLGARIGEALDLALGAGIRYVAAYRSGVPIMHPIA